MKYAIVALVLALVLGYTAVYTPPPPQAPDIDVTEPTDDEWVKMSIQVLTLIDDKAVVKDLETNSLYHLALEETEKYGVTMKPGAVLDVYWNGIVLTSYPGQFGGLFDANLTEESERTTETIVRDLLVHIREENPEWFEGINILSVDMKDSDLDEMQQEAAAHILITLPFEEDLRILQNSKEELIEMGTIVEGEPWNGVIAKITRSEGNSYTVTLSRGAEGDEESFLIWVVWLIDKHHLTTD